MLHEVHNELEPTPGELVDLVGRWVTERAGMAGAQSATGGQDQEMGTVTTEGGAQSSNAGGASKL